MCRNDETHKNEPFEVIRADSRDFAGVFGVRRERINERPSKPEPMLFHNPCPDDPTHTLSEDLEVYRKAHAREVLHRHGQGQYLALGEDPVGVISRAPDLVHHQLIDLLQDECFVHACFDQLTPNKMILTFR